MPLFVVFVGNEYEDPDDPTVIAENELLGAANSIDAAAKKLEKLRPRRSIRVSQADCFSTLYFMAQAEELPPDWDEQTAGTVRYV